jgi:molecular chaperone GrpE
VNYAGGTIGKCPAYTEPPSGGVEGSKQRKEKRAILERIVAQEAQMQKLLADLEKQLAEKDDRHLRLYAEFENYKRRNQREKLDLMETAGRKTMMALLPVLDDFDRAQKQAESDEATKQVWDSGVGLIVKKLYKSLEGQGLKPMASTGEAFDADLHEAITEIPHPEMAGKVVDTTEKGYYLNGKIVRHAKVVVGK